VELLTPVRATSHSIEELERGAPPWLKRWNAEDAAGRISLQRSVTDKADSGFADCCRQSDSGGDNPLQIGVEQRRVETVGESILPRAPSSTKLATAGDVVVAGESFLSSSPVSRA
jgi:hypothetical protein